MQRKGSNIFDLHDALKDLQSAAKPTATQAFRQALCQHCQLIFNHPHPILSFFQIGPVLGPPAGSNLLLSLLYTKLARQPA